MNRIPSRWSVSCCRHRASSSEPVDHDRLTELVEALGHRPQRPRRLEPQPGERQAALLALLELGRQVEVGVDEVAELAVDPVGEDPQPDPDLRGRQARAGGVHHRLGEVLDQLAQLPVEVDDGLGRGAQDGVAEEADVLDRQRRFPGLDEHGWAGERAASVCRALAAACYSRLAFAQERPRRHSQAADDAADRHPPGPDGDRHHQDADPQQDERLGHDPEAPVALLAYRWYSRRQKLIGCGTRLAVAASIGMCSSGGTIASTPRVASAPALHRVGSTLIDQPSLATTSRAPSGYTNIPATSSRRTVRYAFAAPIWTASRPTTSSLAVRWEVARAVAAPGHLRRCPHGIPRIGISWVHRASRAIPTMSEERIAAADSTTASRSMRAVLVEHLLEVHQGLAAEVVGGRAVGQTGQVVGVATSPGRAAPTVSVTSDVLNTPLATCPSW